MWQTLQADAAGSRNLAEFYLAITEAIRQRAIEAEAARYGGWATFYASADEANRQQANFSDGSSNAPFKGSLVN